MIYHDFQGLKLSALGMGNMRLPVMDGDETVYRKADLRAFVLTGKDSVEVWPSGLTRFSRVADSFVVNSSQGGGFKDTWVKAS